MFLKLPQQPLGVLATLLLPSPGGGRTAAEDLASLLTAQAHRLLLSSVGTSWWPLAYRHGLTPQAFVCACCFRGLGAVMSADRASVLMAAINSAPLSLESVTVSAW